MASKCPICGNMTLEMRRGEFRFDPPDNVPGGVMVLADAQWQECSSCGERILNDALSERIEQEATDRWQLLQPEEIRAIREKTGLSQAAMAQWLGVGEKTYTRWEAGKSYQNKSSDNLIRLIDTNPGMLARFEAQRRPERQQVIRNYIGSLSQRTGQQPYAMAAHGCEVDGELAKALQKRLREMARETTSDKQ